MKNKSNLLTLLLAIIPLILFTQCSTNGLQGLLIISNHTDKPIKNIKLGDLVLDFYLDKGQEYNYWYSMALYGKITSEDINETLAAYLIRDPQDEYNYITLYKDNADCAFKIGFQYQLDIHKMDDKYRLYVNPGTSSNWQYGSESDYPAL